MRACLLALTGCATNLYGGAMLTVDTRHRVSIEAQAGTNGVGVGSDRLGRSRVGWLFGVEASLGVELGTGNLRGGAALMSVGYSEHDHDGGHAMAFGARVRMGRGIYVGPALRYARDFSSTVQTVGGSCSNEGSEIYRGGGASLTADLGFEMNERTPPLLSIASGGHYGRTRYNHVHPLTECPPLMQ
ncbi:MAG: hypothetical protein IPQ07_24670 [Myxococcales bacterium]|nr:hypothetical protein [Myxococcales bacterium]